MKNSLKLFFGLCLLSATSLYASAQSQAPAPVPWIVEEVTDGSIPDTILPDQRALAKNGLPDGRISTGKGDIAQAWYSEPTTRYAHAVLGDGIEAGALKVKNSRGEVYTFRLPSTEVFEDITPRLADLDLNGTTEVITILSSRSSGASIAVFGLNGNAFTKIAQTPFIGRSNRWLNIAEIAHFSGSRRPEIAAVITPHLAGVLQFYRMQNGKLTRVAQSGGFSNHFIGSNELRLSKVADVNGNGIPDLVIPSLSRRELVVVGMERKQFKELERIALPARINRPIAIREREGRSEFIVGLDDGRIFSVKR